MTQQPSCLFRLWFSYCMQGRFMVLTAFHQPDGLPVQWHAQACCQMLELHKRSMPAQCQPWYL